MNKSLEFSQKLRFDTDPLTMPLTEISFRALVARNFFWTCSEKRGQ